MAWFLIGLEFGLDGFWLNCASCCFKAAIPCFIEDCCKSTFGFGSRLDCLTCSFGKVGFFVTDGGVNIEDVFKRLADEAVGVGFGLIAWVSIGESDVEDCGLDDDWVVILTCVRVIESETDESKDRYC